MKGKKRNFKGGVLKVKNKSFTQRQRTCQPVAGRLGCVKLSFNGLLRHPPFILVLLRKLTYHQNIGSNLLFYNLHI